MNRVRPQEAIVREQFDAFEAQDWERFAACFSEDVKVYAGLGSLSLQWQGKKQLDDSHRAFFDTYCEPHFQIQRIVVDGDTVAAEYHWTATERRSGRRVGLQRAQFFTVRDGLISEVRVYSLTAFRPMGQAPPPR